MKKQAALPATKLIPLETLKLIADPLRARLLGIFAEAPGTAQEAAARLALPVTRLYYHIHLLEDHDLIQVIDSHPTGGTFEKVYRATARQFIVDREALDYASPQAIEQVNVLIDVALNQSIKTIQQSVHSGAIDLRQSAPDPRALLIRRGASRLSTDQARQFYQRLSALIEEFTRLEPAGELQADYALALAFFPTSLNSSQE